MPLAAILLASCATTTDSGAIDQVIAPIAHASFCSIAKPITWSAADTPATVSEVKAHNAVGKEFCGWGR